ncbi:MAG: efflux RND transporter periplasmic adaptor subunit [Proteobacteria bacterium]|nr:MAG: efflux RND transporter periplasmic adaptor subunit [Pseudomonadota bacterium]
MDGPGDERGYIHQVTTMFRSSAFRLLLIAALPTINSPSAALAAEDLETVVAEYQSTEQERVLDGLIEAVNQATVSAQVSARVTAIHFDVDDFVEQGSLIVQFDDTEYRARLQEARASREAVAAGLDAARSHFDRIENLHRRGTASQSDYDRARADLDTARAQLAAADAVIDRIEQQLEYTQVRAPYGGIVTERHIELGETANPGSPLMSGFSLERLRVVVKFPQRLISTVRQHQKARVLIPGSDDKSIDAEEITIFPYALEGSSTIPVRVLLPENIPDLFPGMLVKVAFSMGNRLRLAIPDHAIVYRSEVVGVYIVDNQGRLSFRHIRTGDTKPDGTVEVLAGLESGERVALNPELAAARLKQQKFPVEQ